MSTYRAFSPGRIGAIAWNTFTELVRLKVFYFVLIFALIIIGNSAFMVKFSFQEEFQVLKDVSLGAMSIFTSLLAIAATAMMLPKDIEDRTLYTILANPCSALNICSASFQESCCSCSSQSC
jgi:ABC-type transport system involved in multi-copper enzyme maturation permease subunit